MLSKAKSMFMDFNAKCMQPRAQLPPLETRQTQITEFFKVTKRPQKQGPLRMPVAEKRYNSDKISYYYRSYSNNNEW